MPTREPSQVGLCLCCRTDMDRSPSNPGPMKDSYARIATLSPSCFSIVGLLPVGLPWIWTYTTCIHAGMVPSWEPRLPDLLMGASSYPSDALGLVRCPFSPRPPINEMLWLTMGPLQCPPKPHLWTVGRRRWGCTRKSVAQWIDGGGSVVPSSLEFIA